MKDEMSAIDYYKFQIEGLNKAYADLQRRYEEERKYSKRLRELAKL